MTNHAHMARYFPEAYKGHVKIEKRKRSIIEIATDKELSPILQRFGDWVLTTEGIDNLTLSYPIGKERFEEKREDFDWISHMREKSWCNIEDFSRVLTAGIDFMKYGII